MPPLKENLYLTSMFFLMDCLYVIIASNGSTCDMWWHVYVMGLELNVVEVVI